MHSKFALVLMASTLAGCNTTSQDQPARGVESVNVPVIQRTDYVFDAAAPDGSLPPSEVARLNAWFSGLDLGYGDAIYVDGSYANGARADIARVTGMYGMMVVPGAPVTVGAVPPGMVRVIVSRTRATVPGCPNWDPRMQPDFENRSLGGYGCGVNSNLAAMVANPVDLIHGHEGPATADGKTGAKAVTMYRDWPLTAVSEGQQKRPLKDVNTKKGD
jgi:pilus assembly protein CpaD